MKTIPQILIVAAVAATAAFASTPLAPTVTAVSSATVEVHQPQLKFEHGAWRLSGCVAPRRGMQSRGALHLDVVTLDASGAWLATTEVPLKAAALRFRPRSPRPHVRYELPLASVSSVTARIEVRVHDDANHQP